MATREENSAARISFVTQLAPVDAYDRALYAVTRSILRALLDQLTREQLEAARATVDDITFLGLAYASRLERDKGMRGDGFEWAVHEAIAGNEPTVVGPISEAMQAASTRFKNLGRPTSLLFGEERARHLGFLEAVVGQAADEAVILPDGRGHPPRFDSWVRVAAGGEASEPSLRPRLKKIWKTDIFLSDQERHRHIAVTVKSNKEHLQGGAGLRSGVVPEHRDLPPGLSNQLSRDRNNNLWVVSLADRSGFMSLYDDAYGAVARAILTVGRHDKHTHWSRPTPDAQRIEAKLEGYGAVRVTEIIGALDKAAQTELTDVDTHLLSVDAPEWLSLGPPNRQAVTIAPKPSFVDL